MATLAQKLGIRPGHTLCLLDAPPGAMDLLRREAPTGVTFATAVGAERFDLILFWPAALDGLAERFARLQHAIHPDGAIWAVIPKKAFAAQRGVAFTWEEMQAAALTTDLVDNKGAAFSEQDYATRFVIRKDRRASYR
jgi:hypothetical protein